MKIKVGNNHILRGLQLCADGKPREECCPVALALQDHGFPKAMVLDGSIQLEGTGNGSHQINAPISVRRFVVAFDNGRDAPRPFDFEIEPAEVMV